MVRKGGLITVRASKIVVAILALLGAILASTSYAIATGQINVVTTEEKGGAESETGEEYPT